MKKNDKKLVGHGRFAKHSSGGSRIRTVSSCASGRFEEDLFDFSAATEVNRSRVKHWELKTDKELDCPPEQSVNVTDRYIPIYKDGDEIMDVAEQLHSLPEMNKAALGALWQKHFGAPPPEQTRRDLIIRILAYKIQEQAFGGLTSSIRRRLRQFASAMAKDPNSAISNTRVIKPGTRLIRQWQGKSYRVTVANSGFEYDGQWYASLSEIARLITGTRWSGPLFFGLKVSAGRRGR